MKQKWKDLTRRERIIFLLDLLILAGMLVLYLLYFVRILDHNAATFAWCLFPFHFFLTAFGEWKTDRDQAVFNIMLGCFVSVVALIGLCSFLMVSF